MRFWRNSLSLYWTVERKWCLLLNRNCTLSRYENVSVCVVVWYGWQWGGMNTRTKSVSLWPRTSEGSVCVRCEGHTDEIFNVPSQDRNCLGKRKQVQLDCLFQRAFVARKTGNASLHFNILIQQSACLWMSDRQISVLLLLPSRSISFGSMLCESLTETSRYSRRHFVLNAESIVRLHLQENSKRLHL